MTNEEAIELLKNMHWSITTKMNREVPSSLALLMAIKILEDKGTNVLNKEIIYCKDCIWSDWYETNDGRHLCYCTETGALGRTETDFCSRGEADGYTN